MFLKPFVLILGNVAGEVPSRPPAVSSSSCRMSLQATEGPRAACGRISRLYSLFSPPLGPSHSGELCPSSRMLPWAWELCPESAKTRTNAFREKYSESFTEFQSSNLISSSAPAREGGASGRPVASSHISPLNL